MQQIERTSKELYKTEDFYRQKWAGIRKLVAKEKKELFQANHFPLGKGQGSVIQITSLVLIKKFQTDGFEVLFLGEAETALRLGIKS